MTGRHARLGGLTIAVILFAAAVAADLAGMPGARLGCWIGATVLAAPHIGHWLINTPALDPPPRRRRALPAPTGQRALPAPTGVRHRPSPRPIPAAPTRRALPAGRSQ